MNQIRNCRSSWTLMGLAALIGLSGSSLGQGVLSRAPRLTIQEVAPATLELLGSEVRILPNGTSPLGLVGDQVNASVAANGSVAFVVWQDNAIDGDGLGIGSRVYNLQTGSASPQILRVNQQALFNQENPVVLSLADGSAVVAWQSGKPGKQSIHARRLSRTGVPQGDEWVVAVADSNGSNESPAMTEIPGGGFAMAWQSSGADGVSSKIHLQRFKSSGSPVSERRVLGTSAAVDRSPTLSALSNGDLAVAWVAEQASADVLNLGGQATRREANSDIFVQIIQADGNAASPIWINGAASPCDRPSMATLPNGKLVIGWSEFDTDAKSSWDIRLAVVSGTGIVQGTPVTLNDFRAYDQTGVRISSGSEGALAVWSTRGADGSGLGVAAKSITANGMIAGDEMILNQTRKNDQFAPNVVSTPSGYRAIWSDFVGINTGVDLAARDLKKVSIAQRQKLKLSWETTVGAQYRLESSTDLVRWTEVQSTQTATSTTQSASIDAGAAAQSYFRVQSDR
ncbi:MAG: hypothetical protein NTY84_13315 [Verrucomicrobia bacterium]|nr:hypothetical protein [Verrucomicrobiota bacterium]